MSRRGWLLFVTMAVLWGIPYLLIRVAVRQLDPGVLVLGRTGPASLLLLPLVIARGQFRAIVRNFWWIVVFAFVEFGVPWYLMASAERHITSSLTSLLICAVPLFSVVVQRVRRSSEHISRRRLVGLAVGALGVAFLVGLGIHGGSIRWIGVMLIVAVGYAFGPIILATKLTDVPGIAVVAGATGVVAISWLPWSIAHWPHHIDHQTWESVGILAVACTAAAFVIFFELVKEVGSTRSVVVTYVNTALAVVLGVTFLSEPLTTGILIGFPLVLIGSVIATSQAPSSSEFASDADELIHG